MTPEINNQVKRMVDEAIPLTMNCEIKRKDEISRRARLRIEIESLIRRSIPYNPVTEYKNDSAGNKITIS